MFELEWLSKRQVILLAAALEFLPCILLRTVKETFALTALGALCSALCALVIVLAAFTHPSVEACLEGHTNAWPWATDFRGASKGLKAELSKGFEGIRRGCHQRTPPPHGLS